MSNPHLRRAAIPALSSLELARPPSAARWVFGAAGIAIVIGATLVYRAKSQRHAPGIEVQRDVPRLEGSTIVSSNVLLTR